MLNVSNKKYNLQEQPKDDVHLLESMTLLLTENSKNWVVGFMNDEM
jgi:hypothetical protein